MILKSHLSIGPYQLINRKYTQRIAMESDYRLKKCIANNIRSYIHYIEKYFSSLIRKLHEQMSKLWYKTLSFLYLMETFTPKYKIHEEYIAVSKAHYIASVGIIEGLSKQSRKILTFFKKVSQ